MRLDVFKITFRYGEVSYLGKISPASSSEADIIEELNLNDNDKLSWDATVSREDGSYIVEDVDKKYVLFNFEDRVDFSVN